MSWHPPPLEAAHVPWLVASSSISRAGGAGLNPAHTDIFLVLYTFSVSSLRRLCSHMGSTWTIQNNLLILNATD